MQQHKMVTRPAGRRSCWEIVPFLRRLYQKDSFRAFTTGVALAALYQVMFGNPAFAAFGSVTTAACNVATALTGPVALAIGFLVICGGLIAVTVGSRRAISTVTWGIIGTVLLVSAATVFTAIVGSGAC